MQSPLKHLLLATAAVMSISAFAEQAQVIGVQGVFEQVNTPSQRCNWVAAPVYEAQQQGNNYGNIALGAVIGGLGGRAIGGGSTGGKDRGSIAGAIIGGVLGDKLSPDRSTSQQVGQVQQCQTVYETSNRQTGYNVTYVYGGRQYNSILSYNPGQYLEVDVTVRPSRP